MINKINEALFKALSYCEDDEKFDLENIKRCIHCKFKTGYDIFRKQYIVFVVKGFYIYVMARERTNDVYVKIYPRIGKEEHLEECTAMWLKVAQLESFLMEFTHNL